MTRRLDGGFRNRRYADPDVPTTSGFAHCDTCAADLSFLLTKDRPRYEGGSSQVRIVDLFAGGGGLTLGAAEAARRVGKGTTVALAVENAEDAADVFALNFPYANLVRSDVAELFDGALGARATASERKVAREIGAVDLLLAGPPCQGHSDLNNHTRRSDPRNALYLRAPRAAEVLSPTFVVIENVPTVQHDKGDVVARSTAALEAVGYTVASKVLDLVRFGVPQRRRRHILLAVLGDLVDPAVILDMRSPCDDHNERSVRSRSAVTSVLNGPHCRDRRGLWSGAPWRLQSGRASLAHTARRRHREPGRRVSNRFPS